MGKTTNRVISLVLAVLMVISMVSAFALPAMAEESATISTALDYDALLKGSNTFFINSSWSSRDLQTGKELDFTFQNKNIKLTYNAKRHFSSYADAFDSIWGGLTAANYFTYNPVIVFAPGEYDTLIQLVGPCTVLGNNAGISPNQARTYANWSTEYLKANGGWAVNPDRKEETVFSAATSIAVNTRDPSDNGAGMPASGDGAKWAVLKEQGFAANSSAVYTTVIDGVTLTGTVHHSGYDVGKPAEYNGQKVTAAGSRKVVTRVQNTNYQGSTKLATAWNTNNDYYTVELDNIRSTGAKMLVERYVENLKITDSYITGFTNALITELMNNSKHSATFEMEGSILYNGPSNNIWAFTGNPVHDNFKFKINDSLLYNVSGGNYGVFKIEGTKGMTQYYTVTNSDIYHDYASTKTYFNGNPNYITSGKVYINFNNNRLISPTVTSFVPNSQYDEAESSTILYYNFDNNYWATSHDRTEVGKKVTFLYGPNGGAPLASGWDYKDPNYFYDYNMTYSSNGTDVAGADFGEGNTVEIKSTNIRVKAFETDGVIVPEFFYDENKVGSALPKFEMATDIGFANKIESIDLSAISGSATFYVRGYYEGTDYESVYKISIIAAKPVDFNDDFMANGLKFAGYDLNYKNTAILVKDTVVEDGETVAYGFLGNNYFRFNVDNDLVFKSLDELKVQMAKVKDPHVVLPSGEYGTFNVDFAATYIGANADIDPVDDTVSVLDDGSDWAIGEGWGDYGETGLGNINVADGVEGKLVFNGITMRGQFNDTQRTMGSEGVAYGNLDITVKNVVVDQDGSAGASDTRTAYVKSLGLGGSGAAYLFNLINARNVNYNNTQVEYDQYGSPTTVDYPNFGDTCDESFTIDSIWLKKSNVTARFMNEFVAPHTTIKNLYRDATSAGCGTIVTWAKVGTATKNGSFKLINSNFRNGVTAKAEHPILGIEGSTRQNAAARLPEGNTYDAVVSNNVFYNAHRENSIAKKLLSIEIAFLSSFEADNNFVYADDTLAKEIGLIGYASAYDQNNASDDLAVLGNISLDGNKFIGINEDVNLVSLGMGKNTPYLTDAFVTTDTETYLTNNKAGIYNSSIGANDYRLNYDGSITINSVRPLGLEPKTDKVSGQYLDNAKMEIGAIISEGKLSDIGVILPEGVTGTWYTDKECTQAFEDKTVEEIGYNAVYYYKATSTIGEDVFEFTYTAEIYTVEFIDFADAEGFDPDYFSNKAVIITEKAAGLAIGSIVVEEWDGVKYRFNAGVNAFATYADARAVDVDVVEILIPEATVENGVINGEYDLKVARSMKLFTPNYKTNPVKTDGFGTNSPSNGKAWGYNTDYDKYKDAVRVKNVSHDYNTDSMTVELYGFTIDCGIFDNGRKVGSTLNFTAYNTLFSRAKSGGYLFCFGSNPKTTATEYVNVNQKNTFTIKNAYFAPEPADKESKSTARIMGEVIPAHVTFDTIYLDFYASNFMYPGYVKNTAGDGSITFKNSYLANSVIRCTKDADKVADATFTESVNNIWNGLSYDENGNYKLDDGQFNTIKSGHSNKMIFDNNILDNYAGFFRPSSGAAALMHICGASFSEISVTNNYIAAPKYIPASNGKTYEVKSFDMYWSAGNKWGDAIYTAEGVFRVTGNVLNFVSGNTTYGESGKRANNFTHYVYDNFRVSNRVNDISDYGLEGQPMMVDSNKALGQGNNPTNVNIVGPTYYRLTADGKYLSNMVNPYSFADRVAIADNKATINGAEGDLFKTVEGGYEFDLSSLIKANFYNNNITVTYGEDTVDMETGKITVTADAFAENGYDFTVKVDSIDGAAAEEVYTFTVTNKGTVAAFAGEGTVIKNTAIMITANANGTDTVVEYWKGVPYTFVSGTTAFKTVEEALTYAAANNLTDVQLLLVNSNNRTDINITYPCQIYAENWNVEPHTKDGNGPDSPTHGYGWDHNVDYLANQTRVYRTYLKEGFPTNGIFEIYGVTMHGVYRDQRTTKANVAKVKVENILLNLEEVNNRYMFVLNSTPNRYTEGNSFTFKNVDFYKAKESLALAWLWGNEFGPQTVTVDNLFIDDAAGVQMLDGTAYMKSETKNAVVEIKNSYIGSSVDNVTTHHVDWEGNKNAVSYDSSTDTLSKNVKEEKLALRFTNNIFHNYISRRSATENSFINVLSYSLREINFTNNYFDIPDGYMKASLDALTYNGVALAKTANADPAMTVDYIVVNNVFNGYAGSVVSFTPSARYHSNSKLTIQNNYRVKDYIYGLYTGNDPMGLPLDIYSKNTAAAPAYYSLNYARDAYDNTVGVPTYNMLDNIIVEADNSVTYKPDEKLFVDGGAIHGAVDHIIKSYPAYNTIKLVVDGVEKDIDATITAATSVAIRLYATDGKTFKDFAVNVTAETAHNFVDFDVVVEATCISDAIGMAYCDCSCGDADCTAYTTKVLVGTSAEAEHTWPARGVSNGDGTCMDNGTWTFTCTVDGCGKTKTEEQPDSTVPHKFNNEDYVAHEPATCSKAGTEIAYCAFGCGETNERTNAEKYPINRKAHIWGAWAYNNDATCVKDGTETRECECGETETRKSETFSAASIPHTWGEYVYNGDVTCKTDGTMTARCIVDGCRARNTIADPNFKADDKYHQLTDYTFNNDATCCEDGTKSAVCSVCETKVTVAAPGTATGHKDVSANYKDVAAGKWYNNAINYNVAHGFISGVAKDEFGVGVNVTRGMFVTILARIAGVDTTKNAVATKFTDVAQNKYYTAAVKWASENAVVSGMTATTFAPDAAITRQQLAVMIVNFAKAQKIELTAKNAAIAFADAGQIANWAKDAVSACQKAGIISGYTDKGVTTFKPNNTATRAEAAQMVYKFHSEFINK